MATSKEAEEVRARLLLEQSTLQQRVVEHTARLNRISFAAEIGDRDAAHERTALLAERLAVAQRLDEVATALASSESIAREAAEAEARTARATAEREALHDHTHRTEIAARLDKALQVLNEAWCEFVESNHRTNDVLGRAGMQASAGRHDAAWLMRAFWHWAPDVSRHVRLAPQLRTLSQPFSISLSERAPVATSEIRTEQPT